MLALVNQPSVSPVPAAPHNDELRRRHPAIDAVESENGGRCPMGQRRTRRKLQLGGHVGLLPYRVGRRHVEDVVQNRHPSPARVMSQHCSGNTDRHGLAAGEEAKLAMGQGLYPGDGLAKRAWHGVPPTVEKARRHLGGASTTA
jgi:hypothetical protein